jgi:hypothetical protein
LHSLAILYATNCIERIRSKIKFVRYLLFQTTNVIFHQNLSSWSKDEKIQPIDMKHSTCVHFFGTMHRQLRLSKKFNRLCPVSLTGHGWGGAFNPPHILNLTYHSACLSYGISITVSGVGGYPVDLKKFKTACRVKLYRTATWWGCNPCRSRLMGLFIQPNPYHPHPHPRVTVPYKILRKLALQLMGY